MTRRLIPFTLLLCLAACGSKSPTAPSTPAAAATPTRIIALSGAMAFGNIQVGQSFTANLTVQNQGNAVMTVTGMSGSNGITANITPSMTSFTVPPGGSQNVVMRFAPTAAKNYSGAITVNADQTSGSNTIAFSGTGSLDGLPVFTQSGTGDNVFTVPSYVTKIRITANTPSTCQNFVARVAGSTLVNVILGSCSVADERTHDGTYLIAGGGTAQTTISAGVNWTFSEVR